MWLLLMFDARYWINVNTRSIHRYNTMHRTILPRDLAQTIFTCIPVRRCGTHKTCTILLHNDDCDCILVWTVQRLQSFECFWDDTIWPVIYFGTILFWCLVLRKRKIMWQCVVSSGRIWLQQHCFGTTKRWMARTACTDYQWGLNRLLTLLQSLCLQC